MTKPHSIKVIAGLTLLSAATFGCKDDGGGGPLTSQLGFDEARSEVVVILNRDVGGGEKVHARVRSLAEGDTLDCATMVSGIPEFGARGAGVYGGEAVTEDQFHAPPPNPIEESPDELQARMAQTFYVDVCVEKGGTVLHEARYSLNQALDRIGANGKFDTNDDGVRIVSNTAYAQACEEELGPNPLFKPVLDANGDVVPGDYLPANCLDGVPIESNIDGEAAADGENRKQGEARDRWFYPCDEAQYIYNHCEPDARTGENGPRIQTARNEQGTDWVLLCRKSLEGEGLYNDIAMIGHNPLSGKTCFFQNQMRSRTGNLTPDGDGNNVPWPGDTVNSDASPVEGNDMWLDQPQGGANAGIGCAGCHDADPFIHTPWIDTAKREDGTTVVPKIGVHDDYIEGYNRPYVLLDQEDQGWEIPRRLVSEEVAACTKCHAINAGQWISDSNGTTQSDDEGEGCVSFACSGAPWMNRLVGEDSNWARLITESHQGFEDVFWMPPNAGEVLTEDSWPNSEFAAAVEFMLNCGREPDNGACIWEEAPTEPGGAGELPETDLTGEELARAAVAAIGGKYLDENGQEVAQTTRCSDCHAITRFGVGEWRDRTQEAVSAGINIRQDVEELSQAEALELVNYMRKDPSNPDSVFEAYKMGVYSAMAQFPYFRHLFAKAYSGGGGGSTMVTEQEITSRVDRDAFENHSARLAAGEWTFTLTHDEANPGGDADLYVRTGSAPTLEDYECRPWLNGSEETCSLTLESETEVHWAVHGYGDSNAFGLRVEGNVVGGGGEVDPEAAYAAFLARVSMPKGSHPPFSGDEAAVVAKWFIDEDINHLTSVMPEAARPETCADAIAFSGLASSGMPTDDSWFTGHLDDMEFEGWHARNVERGINMFGCSGTDGTDCFESNTDTGFAHADVAGSRVVDVADFSFNTSFWMRSSADGRFVGNGGGSGSGFGATITDLIADRDIGVRGSYDPGFFPNNDGFIMQGGGAGLCGQSVLTNDSLIDDGIDFTEPGCSNAQDVALYQHVAVDLDGGDYFIINAQFTSDPGSGNSDPRAPFGEGSSMRFHPLVFDGSEWDQKETLTVPSPYEGDSVLSPSGRMVISRFAGPNGNALGYSVRRVNAVPSGSSYEIDINQPVRFVCTPGAKANISFDERFSVTHTYENGTANLYLTDLLTLQTYQITDMPTDTRALFPHFRSDGWIYFLAQGNGPDRAMATDAAVVLSNL